jgi:hypothetical protein
MVAEPWATRALTRSREAAKKKRKKHAEVFFAPSRLRVIGFPAVNEVISREAAGRAGLDSHLPLKSVSTGA